MFSTFKLSRKWLLVTLGVFCMVGLIAFTEVQHGRKHVRRVDITLQQADGHQFLTRRDVMGYLTNEGNDPVIGQDYAEIDLRQLEKRLLQHGLVKSCQISRDLNGDMRVAIEQPRPVARLVKTVDGTQPVMGQYVSEEGRFFPISMNYTARVPILTGTYFFQNRSLSNARNQPLLALLRYVQADPFWRAQITEISVDKTGDVTMWPELGNHRIELGQPTDLPTKFKKIKLAYTDIFPAKGWDRYSRVNVQYRNQIICE